MESREGKASPNMEEAATVFLERDFQECFAEKRRYESLTWEVAKFTFGAYAAVLAISVGLYTFSMEQGVDLLPMAIALLAVGLLVGLFMLLLVVRTRVYFVVVTRYINEQRAFFLAERPLGFDNKSGMLMDPGKPPYFSTSSTQSWLALLLATLNSIVGGVLGFLVASLAGQQWLFGVVAFGLLELTQVSAAVLYLRSLEKKSASEAVFGR